MAESYDRNYLTTAIGHASTCINVFERDARVAIDEFVELAQRPDVRLDVLVEKAQEMAQAAKVYMQSADKWRARYDALCDARDFYESTKED